MAHFYFVPPGSRLISGETVFLSGAEAAHAAKVARLRVGERIILGDGNGTTADAEAVEISRDRVSLVVVGQQTHQRLTPELWLVQSLAKSGRDEQAIEAATEVGVTGVIPLSAMRSVVKWDAGKAEGQKVRWQRIVTEASKQAIQPYIPEVRQVHSLAELLVSATGWNLLALDHRADRSLFEVARDLSGDRPVAVIVGPEGGLSSEELEQLDSAGAKRVRMGAGVLRTSTAGPIALALLHQRLGHW